jgi:RNA polymerase sigma factor (sigma-70 family)
VTESDQGSGIDYDQEVLRFHRKHAGEVAGYLRRIGTPAEHVEEIVNDAFLAARTAWDELRTGNPRAYVFAVARRQRANRIDKDARRTELIVVKQPDEFEDDRRLTSRDHSDAVIDQLTMKAALAELPERQCEVIFFRHVADMSVADTAKIMNMPEGTVKSDLSRGMAALRKLLNTAEEANEQ